MEDQIDQPLKRTNKLSNKKAYYALFLFGFGAAANAMVLSDLGYLQSKYSGKDYTNKFWWNILPYVFSVLAILGPGAAYNQSGIKQGYVIGALLTLSAYLLKLLFTNSVFIVTLIMIISKISTAFFVLAFQTVSQTWFTSDSRVGATVILTTMYICFGQAAKIEFLNYYPDKNSFEKHDGVDGQIISYIIIAAIFILPGLFALKGKPESAPSGAAAKEVLGIRDTINVIKEEKGQFYFIFGLGILTYITSLAYNTFTQCLLIIDQESFYLNSMLGLIVVIFGGLISYFSYQKAKKFRFLVLIPSLLIVATFQVAYFFQGKVLFEVSFYFVSMLESIYLPMAIEMLAEISFPSRQTVILGMAYLLDITFQFVLGFVTDETDPLKPDTKQTDLDSYWIYFTTLAVLGNIALMVTKEKKMRYDYELMNNV